MLRLNFLLIRISAFSLFSSLGDYTHYKGQWETISTVLTWRQIFQKLVIAILDVKFHVIPVIERNATMALSDMVEPQGRKVQYITSTDSTFNW